MVSGGGKPAGKAAADMLDAARDIYDPARIESEKLRLELERLKLEKERVEAGIADAHSRLAPDPAALTFGLGAACVVASVCLFLGGMIGFSTGLEIGVRRSPAPRKILVGRRFAAMMDARYEIPERRVAEPAPWLPRRSGARPGAALITR